MRASHRQTTGEEPTQGRVNLCLYALRDFVPDTHAVSLFLRTSCERLSLLTARNNICEAPASIRRHHQYCPVEEIVREEQMQKQVGEDHTLRVGEMGRLSGDFRTRKWRVKLR